ncbi:MAG: sulfotransferase family protein [Proteobacteria bacterium]|nr:sulfotransferase family protein [Pseudomonadota bacterium]
MGKRKLRYASDSFGPLGKNHKHMFAAGSALVDYPGNAIYSFIPKNGCTTMRLSLAIRNGCIDGPDQVHWVHANNSTFCATLRELLTVDYTYVVLRCPFRRLASVFLDKIVGDKAPLEKLWNHAERQFDRESITFTQFVALLAESALRIDIHWRPQVDFLVYETYDAYFQLERFGHVMEEVRRRTALQIVDARNLTKHGIAHLQTIGAYAEHAHTPAHRVREMKRSAVIPDPMSVYSEDTVEQVRRLYRDDLLLYAMRFGTEHLMFGEQWVDLEPKTRRFS